MRANAEDSQRNATSSIIALCWPIKYVEGNNR